MKHEDWMALDTEIFNDDVGRLFWMFPITNDVDGAVNYICKEYNFNPCDLYVVNTMLRKNPCSTGNYGFLFGDGPARGCGWFPATIIPEKVDVAYQMMHDVYKYLPEWG